MSPLKLLVVDDDENVLSALELVLRKAGYQVETTSDVFGLPLKVGNLKPDGVLLDVDLPAMTGDKLALNLKRLRSTRETKIIFHSAEDEEKLQHLVDLTAVDGYIPKGLGKVEFLQRLRAFLSAEPRHA